MIPLPCLGSITVGSKAVTLVELCWKHFIKPTPRGILSVSTYLCRPVDGFDSPDEDEASLPLPHPILVLIVVLAAVAIFLVVGLILWAACAKDAWWKRRGERVPTDDGPGASAEVAIGGYKT